MLKNTIVVIHGKKTLSMLSHYVKQILETNIYELIYMTTG